MCEGQPIRRLKAQSGLPGASSMALLQEQPQRRCSRLPRLALGHSAFLRGGLKGWLGLLAFFCFPEPEGSIFAPFVGYTIPSTSQHYPFI